MKKNYTLKIIHIKILQMIKLLSVNLSHLQLHY
jgi:hypothetical protein